MDFEGSWKREFKLELGEAKRIWIHLAVTKAQLYVGGQRWRRKPSIICYFKKISINISIATTWCNSSLKWFTENIRNRPVARVELFLWASVRETVWERSFLTFFKSYSSWRKWQNNLILMLTETGSRVSPPSEEQPHTFTCSSSLHLVLTCSYSKHVELIRLYFS